MSTKDLVPGIARAAALLAASLWLGVAGAEPAADYDFGLQAYLQDDVVTAMQYLERAATAGHADAQYLLGYILDKAGENETAMGHYQSAFDNGNADAAFALGTMYASGDGVEKNTDMARDWYERGAAAGSNMALEVLARAYLDGSLGLAQDEARARELLGRAADNGYDPARTLLESLDQEQSTATTD